MRTQEVNQHVGTDLKMADIISLTHAGVDALNQIDQDGVERAFLQIRSIALACNEARNIGKEEYLTCSSCVVFRQVERLMQEAER